MSNRFYDHTTFPAENSLASSAGLRAELDLIEAGFTAVEDEIDSLQGYSHPTGDGNLNVPATGTTSNGKVLKAGATAGSIGWATLTKADVGLSNVDNTSDATKNIGGNAATATKLATARTINGVPFDGTADVVLATGVATEAVKLATARTVALTGAVTGSASFDGSADVTINTTSSSTTASQLTTARQIALTGAVSGSALFNGSTDITINTTSNSTTATKLATARTIYLAGDVGGYASFDGSADVYITVAVSDDSHNHVISNVDGLQAALDGKASSSHTHSGYASSSHTHSGYLATSGGSLTGALSTSSTIVVNNTTASSSATTGSLRTTGGLGVGGAIYASGNVTAYSDARLKTNIVEIADALDKVRALRGVTYNRIDTGERQTGVIAQEVQAVLPEAVSGDEYLGVAYGNMVGLLIQAIKEQADQIDQLKNRIQYLEAR